MKIHAHDITGLLLAGGEGMRMGGRDKGLQHFHGMPLAAQVLQRLSPQVGTLLISANRHLDDYRQFGCAVIPDALPGFQGPLAGMHAGLMQCQTAWLLSVPCDAPFLPHNLAQRLGAAAIAGHADLAYAVTTDHDTHPNKHQNKHHHAPHDTRHDTRREHPVFALMRRDVRDDLAAYLAAGGRKVREWQRGLRAVAVPFDDARAFSNLNTADELQAAQAAQPATAADAPPPGQS